MNEKPEPQKEPSVSKGAKKFLKGKKTEKLFSNMSNGKKPEPKIDTKPEEKEKQKQEWRSAFDKAVNDLHNYILDEGVIIPIGLHKYSPEQNVISQKFDIEVEVRLSVKEKK